MTQLSVSYFIVTWKPLLLRLLLFEFYFLFCVASELRFCFNGPQRILYKDCPGGFVTKHTLKPTCMYYYKSDSVPNLDTSLSEDICLQDTNIHVIYKNISEANDGLQLIEFATSVEEAKTDGSDPDYESCNATCLSDWIEPKYWFPVKPLKDKEELNETTAEMYRKDYVELTKVVLIKIINEDEFDDNLEPSGMNSGVDSGIKLDFLLGNASIINKPMTSLMKLLAKSMRITHMKCVPFIEQSFYALVFRTMIELRRMNDNFPDMSIVPLKRIMNILDQCEKKNVSNFIINGTRCEDKYIAQTITDTAKNLTWAHKLRPDSFRWGRYDPIIEAAWSSIAFVHAFCFDDFSKDMLHYSLFIKGMNEIFIQPLVEKHWMYPFPVGKGMTLWEMSYDTPDIQSQMTNLDACVQGAYIGSVFDSRLDRPFNKQEYLENPEYEENTDTPVPGWNKTVEEYWKYYEKRGFQEMVRVLGYCAQSLEDLNTQSDVYAEGTCFLDDQGSQEW